MVEDFKIDINGLCRFSYPFALGSFSGEQPSMAALKEQLYNVDRLRERLFIFSNIFLPPLRHQTDTDYRIAVLIGEQMPESIREALLNITHGIDSVHVVVEPEGQDPKELCGRIFHSMRRADADLVGEFRLDDDDAIAVDFVSKSRQAGYDFNGPITQSGVAGVDFPSGAFVYFSEKEVQAKRLVLAHLSCGQVIFLNPASSKTAIKFRHYRMWQRNLYISLPDEVMYLRSVHRFNTSGVDQTVKTKDVIRLTERQIEIMMRERFRIDLPRLRDDWKNRAF